MISTEYVRPLTGDAVQALRAADSITFHHRADGEAFIRAHLSGGYEGNRVVFTARQQKLYDTPDGHDRYRQIRVASTVRLYAGDGGSSYGRTFTCFYMEHTPQFRATTRTILSLLRVGDVLSLEWVGSNNNDHLTRAGLHHDELHLHVAREKGERVEMRTFEVGDSVCPDNSARMVRCA